MSWVAERKAATKNIANVAAKNRVVGKKIAEAAKLRPIPSCIYSTQVRLVDIISTNGLQKGFITHGK